MQLSSLIRKASYWSEQRLIQRTTANQSGEDKWSWNYQLQMGSPFPKAQGKSWRRGPKSGKTVELVSLRTALWTLSNCACLYKINVVNILAWMEERLKDPTHTWDYWKLIAVEERSVHFHQRCGLCGLPQWMAPYTFTDAQDGQDSVS